MERCSWPEEREERRVGRSSARAGRGASTSSYAFSNIFLVLEGCQHSSYAL